MKKPAKKKTVRPWHETAKDLPIALFHTSLGPIIGKVDKAPANHGQFRIRLWAPAVIQVGLAPSKPDDTQSTTMQQRVVFQPIALVESHFDLSVATPTGRSPVPDALVPGYEEYFAKFAAGTYALTRVVARVEQGAPHAVETPTTPPAAENSTSNESDETNVS